LAAEKPAAEREEAVGAATGTREAEHAAVSSAIDRFAGTREAHEDGSDPDATTDWEVQSKQKDLLAATWGIAGETPAAKETAAPVALQAAVTEPLTEQIAETGHAEEPALEGNFVEDGAGVAEEPRYYEAISEVRPEVHAEVGPEIASAETEAVVEADGGAYAATDELEKAEEAAPAFDAGTAYVADVTLSEAEPVQAEPAAEAEAAAGETEAAHANAEVAPAESVLKAAVLNAANGNSPAAHGAGDTVNDDVVARVLANLSPEVLQAVTRQILKPVVEAMVQEELNKKK